jgi:hypothetical protein
MKTAEEEVKKVLTSYGLLDHDSEVHSYVDELVPAFDTYCQIQADKYLKEEEREVAILTTQLAKANSDKERLGESIKKQLEGIKTNIEQFSAYPDAKDLVVKLKETAQSNIDLLTDCGITL